MARLKILLVEDQTYMMKTYERLISVALGHKVVPAYDGHEASMRFDDESGIDAVITDVRMKPRSGIYLLQFLNARPIHRQVPVLVHSGEPTFTERGLEIDLAKDIPEVFSFARFRLKVSEDSNYIANFLDEVSSKKEK